MRVFSLRLLLPLGLAAVVTTTVVAARTVMIGDSMFAGAGEQGNGGSTVQEHLEAHCGHAIENKAIVGSSLHEGWTQSVPAYVLPCFPPDFPHPPPHPPTPNPSTPQ